MQGKSWYFSRKGRVEGPFTVEQLKQRIQLNDGYLIWNPKLARWVEAEHLFGNASKATQSLSGKVNQPSAISDDFLQKWRALEKKQAEERELLINEIMAKQQHYGRMLEKSRVSDNNPSFKSTSSDIAQKANLTSTRQQSMKPVVPKPNVHSFSQKPLDERKHKPQSWTSTNSNLKTPVSTQTNTSQVSAAKQKTSHSKIDSIKSKLKVQSKSDFLWPVENAEPEINAFDLEIAAAKINASKTQAVFVPKDVDHDEMMRRVTRRRRRRVR